MFLECRERAAIWALFHILLRGSGGRKNSGSEKILKLLKVIYHGSYKLYDGGGGVIFSDIICLLKFDFKENSF